MERKKQIRIKPGDTYGVIKILDVDKTSKNKLKTWNCKCEKCGKVFQYVGSAVFKHQNAGCPDCRKTDSHLRKIEKANQYIGKYFGQLQVIGCAGIKKPYGIYTPIMICECKKCGSVTEIPLVRLKSGGASECMNCCHKNLALGSEISKDASLGGSLVFAIDGRRELNKNNASGHNGVSWSKSANKWRAYIYFKRKQYHLGVFDKMEDAVSARNQAEKEIYGNFLEWYQKEYPKEWEKIQKTMKL